MWFILSGAAQFNMANGNDDAIESFVRADHPDAHIFKQVTVSDHRKAITCMSHPTQSLVVNETDASAPVLEFREGETVTSTTPLVRIQ